MKSTVFKLGGPFSVVTLLVVGFLIYGTGHGTVEAQQVDTEAEVIDAGGVAPEVICKWELPDMQSGVSDNTAPDPRIQYGTASDPSQHDDDRMTRPSVDPACDSPEGGAIPGQPNNVMNMIQVLPNQADDPEEVLVQVWMAVKHPHGISNIDDAFWHVSHPDGSLKVKLHGADVVRVEREQCQSLGSSIAAGTMFNAAHGTGQVSAKAIDETTNTLGLVVQCQKGELAIFYSKFSISKEQPCGEYKIEATAGSRGNKNTLTNFIDVVCFFHAVTDFEDTGIDWGFLRPGNRQVVSGDLNISTPDSPTIMNTGNHGMGVGIKFAPLVQITDADGDTPQIPAEIRDFDACFGTASASGVGTDLECVDPIGVGERVFFSPSENNSRTALESGESGIPQVLCSNELGQLDLSVEPQSNLPPGKYQGSLDLMFRTVHSVCPTDLEGHLLANSIQG